MRNKIITLIMAMGAVAVMNAYDFNASNEGGKDLYYNIIGDTEVEITRISKDTIAYEGDIVIPETVSYNGVTYTVTRIGKCAFLKCSNMTSISMPETITEICDSAFQYCKGLSEIHIPKSVTKSGYRCFVGCKNIKKVYVDDLKSWCNIQFVHPNTSLYGAVHGNPLQVGADLYVNGELVTDLIIPYGTSLMSAESFRGCASIHSVFIPEGLKVIETAVFSECKQLEKVSFPSTIDSIGLFCFSGCNNITEVRSGMADPVSIFQSTFTNTVYQNAMLYIPAGTKDDYGYTDYWLMFKYMTEMSGLRSYTLNVTDMGYATIYLDYPVVIPDDVEAVMYSTHLKNDTLITETVTGLIPAFTPVIVKAAEGTYNFVESTESAESINGNVLRGTLAELPLSDLTRNGDDKTVLTLQKNEDGKVGFYPIDQDTINSYNAYALFYEGNELKQLAIDSEYIIPEPNAINDVNVEASAKEGVYDISGRKVGRAEKGIYIINGKKVILK